MEAKASLEPGTAIPGTTFRVGKLLAHGVAGEIYALAGSVDSVLETVPLVRGSRQEIARALSALRKIEHPCLMPIFAVGTSLAERYVPHLIRAKQPGESLRERLDRGEVSVAYACNAVLEILEGLARAHAHGVAHGEIKPDNVVLVRLPDGTVRPTLDGLGRMHQQGVGRFVGSLAYAAPEQILSNKLTPAADVFAMGLLLYEMLAGRGPWDDLTAPAARVHALVSLDPPPLSRWVRVEPRLERLVMRALAKDPDDRPSAVELSRGLLALDPGERRFWAGSWIAAAFALCVVSWVLYVTSPRRALRSSAPLIASPRVKVATSPEPPEEVVAPASPARSAPVLPSGSPAPYPAPTSAASESHG